MAKNEFLPFGTADGANVLTPTAYGQLAARGVGFTTGVAKSQELNTVWRQASEIAATVAQFIANHSGDDVLDDGNMANLLGSLEKALKAKIDEEGVVRSVNNHSPDASGDVELTADDIDAVKKTGDTMTGALNVDAKISLSDGLEIGNPKAPSPAYIDFHTDGTATDYNARIISPQGSTELQLIAADNANNGSGIIRLLGNNGDQLSFALQGTANRGLAWRKWGSDERPTVLELDVDGGIWLINVDHTKDDKAALGVNGVVNCEGVNVGDARMAADGNIWGTRWNPSGGWLWDAIVAQIQNVGDMSVNGDQWWARLNLNGGTLIVQGGFVNGQVSDDGIIERVPLNISVPNRLLGVWTIIRNFAQGYETTWNPQVQDLSGARDAFSWLHGTKERMIYWIAVGY